MTSLLRSVSSRLSSVRLDLFLALLTLGWAATPGQAQTPPVAQAVAAGDGHSMVLMADGTLWAMGRNDYGQLGDGTTTDRLTAVQVASGVASVAAGDYHMLYVKTDGTLWAMGYNDCGQLGDGTTTTDRSTAVQVASGVASVAAGTSHTLYVKTDGTLWAMGYNYFGQLGDGTTKNRLTAVQVASGVAGVAAGTSHTLYVTTDGTLWAMGRNRDGQLGDGTTTYRSTPVPVATLTGKWSQLAALSARAPVGTGDQTLILGFVFAGGGKPTMIRGVGPGLVKGDASLAGQVLVDPVLTLNELQTGGFVAIATNDNWGGAEEIRTKMSALGMGALDDTSTDAVMLTTPTRAVYTAQISGANQTTGLALAEVYDANFSDKAKRLTALSIRNQVGAGSSMMIAGLVITGDAPKRVIIRGVGPGLVPTVAEALVLANPTLQLNKLNTATMTWSVVGTNDDWGGSAELATAMSKAGMGALATDSKDAVLLMELQPGIYTAQLSGEGDTTGIGLVEIYEAP